MARRTSLLHQASRRGQDLQALLAPVASSQYATPVASYIDWLGCLTDIQQDARGGMKDLADELEKDVLGGKYHISPQTGYITFQSSRRGSGPVGLHAAPGCANSLMPLWVYLRHQARSRQTLMIEEPEIQLEPSQQRALMHLMLALDRCGVNVVMTTCGTHIVETVQDCAARKGTVRADPGEVAVLPVPGRDHHGRYRHCRHGHHPRSIDGSGAAPDRMTDFPDENRGGTGTPPPSWAARCAPGRRAGDDRNDNRNSNGYGERG